MPETGPERPPAASSRACGAERIVIRNAHKHNLKNIDLDIPRNSLVVFTGVSGSGKSSLAFDTIFAEGRRRYVETLSSHARQILQRLPAPEADEIRGLSPAVAVDQKGLPRNPRSTVGTLTEIHDYLRLLYARLGVFHCPACGVPARAHTVPEAVDAVMTAWPEGSRVLILAPVETPEKDLSRLLQRLRRDGFARIRTEDGAVLDLDPLPLLPRRPVHRLQVVIDRIALDPSKDRRLADSLELAFGVGEGLSGAALVGGEELAFSRDLRCGSCGRTFPPATPSLFSFHHPSGMCPVCRGLGLASPFSEEDELKDPDKTPDADDLEAPCPACDGSRLGEAARSVRLGGLGIHEVSRLPLPEFRTWLENLPLTETESRIADRPRREIQSRLDIMEELRLSYLSLDRSAHTLSGGEAGRVRLARQLGSPMSGIIYVLDEPGAGLHPHDHRRLLSLILRLREAGNTVIAVDHHRETILAADHVVDLGPGAGELGGEIVFSGTPEALLLSPDSLTGAYLSGRADSPALPRRIPFARGILTLTGARGRNLRNITAQFPLGCFTCVTGVSGSGKSTLVLETLYRILARKLYGNTAVPAPFDELQNADAVTKVVLSDQSPIGRTPRSSPATATGLFDLIRGLFAQNPEARARGYTAGRFSFNARGGRCEACRGDGLQKIEMAFLPDVYVTCPACGGTRYGRETLDIRFKGKSIADVLDMTVNAAASLFESLPALRRKLEALQEAGLGYVRLGQPAGTLSGGEARRVKLAAELWRKTTPGTLYLLDEPTTGLHFDDVRKLLHTLQKLVDAGGTVVAVEHHPDVLRTADYIIDLGPEGGAGGGEIMAAGSPEEVAESGNSPTSAFLKAILAEKPDQPPKER